MGRNIVQRTLCCSGHDPWLGVSDLSNGVAFGRDLGVQFDEHAGQIEGDNAPGTGQQLENASARRTALAVQTADVGTSARPGSPDRVGKFGAISTGQFAAGRRAGGARRYRRRPAATMTRLPASLAALLFASTWPTRPGRSRIALTHRALSHFW